MISQSLHWNSPRTQCCNLRYLPLPPVAMLTGLLVQMKLLEVSTKLQPRDEHDLIAVGGICLDSMGLYLSVIPLLFHNRAVVIHHSVECHSFILPPCMEWTDICLTMHWRDWHLPRSVWNGLTSAPPWVEWTNICPILYGMDWHPAPPRVEWTDIPPHPGWNGLDIPPVPPWEMWSNSKPDTGENTTIMDTTGVAASSS